MKARELGELVNGRPENVDAVLPQLRSILSGTTDPVVVASAVEALGHAQDQRAAHIVLDHVGLDHESVEVRRAIARTLSDGVEPSGETRERVIAALVVLTRDADGDVRDWACFGLGQVEATSPEARDALAARLTDQDDGSRCEALLALARVRDPRALASLVERLGGHPDDVWLLELEAAAELADPALGPLLARLADAWGDDDDKFAPALALALARCAPNED